ncbi:MAG: TraB/GumN family protein [Saprospiraceae bacterium]|jgi:uncharacterized protein YbaP (TraB family)
MKIPAFLVILLGLIPGILFGQSEDQENGLLWSITGNGLEQPSYLYGTIHMIDSDDFFWPNGTLEAFSATERVVFEIDMDMMNDMSAQFSMLMGVMMADGTTLGELLSEEDYAFVKKEFDELGLPMFLLERMKPMFLTIFAGGDFSPEQFTGGNIKSYEMEFMAMAEEQSKETGGLESVEFQMSIFDSIPYKAQADMLVESLRSSDNGEDQLKEMVELYKKQDLNGLNDMLNSEGETLMEYDHIILEGRNRAWIPVMDEMMKEKPTFFAVGAGHLAGETGVIHLLRAEGYQLRPIKSL